MRKGIERASHTLENIKTAWLTDQQVAVEDGRSVAGWVTMLVTFVLRDK
jgi:flavin-binding protein dodecin